MNDRYLFRGKRADNDEWIVGYHCKLILCARGGAKLLDAIQLVVSHCEVRSYEIDPATLEQCTGLSAVKSYRGTQPEDLLIFEGDIIRDRRSVHAVIYDFDNGRFLGVSNVKYNNQDRYLLYINTELQKFVEIIGNVHDKSDGEECNGN